MDEATKPPVNSTGCRADPVGDELAEARGLLRQALKLLDHSRQHGAAARVASALEQLGEPPPDEEAMIAWLDEWSATATPHADPQ